MVLANPTHARSVAVVMCVVGGSLVLQLLILSLSIQPSQAPPKKGELMPLS